MATAPASPAVTNRPPDPKATPANSGTPVTTAEPAKPGKPAKTATPEVELDFISKSVFTLTPELTDVTAPARARNEKQAAMDELVQKNHAQWVKAGKPGTWPLLVSGKCVATYFVEPDKAPGLHKLIKGSADFLGYAVRYGTPFKATRELIIKYNLPEEYIGREVVSFAVRDRRQRTVKDDGTKTAEAEKK